MEQYELCRERDDPASLALLDPETGTFGGISSLAGHYVAKGQRFWIRFFVLLYFFMNVCAYVLMFLDWGALYSVGWTGHLFCFWNLFFLLMILIQPFLV